MRLNKLFLATLCAAILMFVLPGHIDTARNNDETILERTNPVRVQKCESPFEESCVYRGFPFAQSAALPSEICTFNVCRTETALLPIGFALNLFTWIVVMYIAIVYAFPFLFGALYSFFGFLARIGERLGIGKWITGSDPSLSLFNPASVVVNGAPVLFFLVAVVQSGPSTSSDGGWGYIGVLLFGPVFLSLGIGALQAFIFSSAVPLSERLHRLSVFLSLDLIMLFLIFEFGEFHILRSYGVVKGITEYALPAILMVSIVAWLFRSIGFLAGLVVKKILSKL